MPLSPTKGCVNDTLLIFTPFVWEIITTGFVIIGVVIEMEAVVLDLKVVVVVVRRGGTDVTGSFVVLFPAVTEADIVAFQIGVVVAIFSVVK